MLVVECGSRGCGGDTKGLAGVTKGMVVRRPRMGRSPTGVRAPRVGIHESVGTFVSSAGTGTVVERRDKVFFLFDRVVLGD